MFEEKRIISHRGIYDNKGIFENTLEAFELAMKKNYIIECDVHLTLDNKIVVFHDNCLKRFVGKDIVVEKSTYSELNQQNIFHIPLLEELLELVKGKVPLLIEIKQLGKVGKLEKILMNILKKYDGKYAIQSFNPKVLLWFKKYYPDVLRGQLACSFKNKRDFSIIKKILLRNMFFNKFTTPHFISYKYNEIKLNKIKYFQSKGIKVLGWTVKKTEDYNKFIICFDNLICEDFI